jgi:hypothetical protein
MLVFKFPFVEFETLMRRSKEVPLTILAVLALSVVSCRSGRRNCVDGQNHLLPDSACQAPGSGSSGSYGSGGSYGYYGAHYMYGGSSGGHVGDSVVGGSVSRGGFGGIGGSHGAGGE